MDPSIKDYDDFKDALGTGWEKTDLIDMMSKELAKKMNKEINIESKQRFGAKRIAKQAVGLKEELLANGYQNARHLAAGLHYGKTGIIVGGVILDLGEALLHTLRVTGETDQEKRAKLQERIESNLAEFAGDIQAGLVSSQFEDMLSNDTPWYALSSEFDAAWNANKHRLADLWRKQFCLEKM